MNKTVKGMVELDIEALGAAFYVREDGLLINKFTRWQSLAGEAAGKMRPDGYICVHFNGKKYMAHRIIFTLTHGRAPIQFIDHINGVKSDNRPCNLREATNAENIRHSNWKNRLVGGTGAPGVRVRPKGTFDARIRVLGKRIHLGTFRDLELAEFVYQLAVEKYHGTFASPSCELVG